MDLVPTLLQLSLIHILMAMIPGPNTVVVSYCSATVSRRAGLMAVAGVSSATFLWVLLSLLGAGALLAQAGDAFRFLRLAGAAYLVYAGIRMLVTRSGQLNTVPRQVYRSPFRAGFLTTLSNPKSAVFWTSVFALVLPAGAPVWFHAVVLALMTVQSALWYGGVSLLLSTNLIRTWYARLGTALNRIAGGFMVFFGLKIANDVRAEIAARMV